MNVNVQSTKHAKWTTRIWRTLAALDDAISVSPMEHWKNATQRWNKKFGLKVSRSALTVDEISTQRPRYLIYDSARALVGRDRQHGWSAQCRGNDARAAAGLWSVPNRRVRGGSKDRI
jgi:hypothetical protein